MCQDDQGEWTEYFCVVFKIKPLAVQETSGFSRCHRNKCRWRSPLQCSLPPLHHARLRTEGSGYWDQLPRRSQTWEWVSLQMGWADSMPTCLVMDKSKGSAKENPDRSPIFQDPSVLQQVTQWPILDILRTAQYGFNNEVNQNHLHIHFNHAANLRIPSTLRKLLCLQQKQTQRAIFRCAFWGKEPLERCIHLCRRVEFKQGLTVYSLREPRKCTSVISWSPRHINSLRSTLLLQQLVCPLAPLP